MSQCLKETKVRIYLYKDNYEKIRNSEYSTTSSLILQITFYYRQILNKFLEVSTLVFHFPALPSDPFKSFSFFPPVKNPFPLLKKKKKKNISRNWALLPAFTQEGEHDLVNHVTKEMTWLCQNLLKHYLVILLLGGEITFTKTGRRSVSEPTEVLLQEIDSHKNNF